MATVAETVQDEVHVDPDAQATVTDFLDYTEYLPSDLTRSLTLVGKLEDSYLSSTNRIHEVLSAYGNIQRADTNKQWTPQELRKEISYYLDYALNARESAHAESSRLYEEVDRHYNRLASVKLKLLALPKPPSRDPSPVPLQHSPQANRARLGRDEEAGGTQPPRITLRLDNARSSTNALRYHGANNRPRPRVRKVTVPGEVLPPPNPDSPPSFTDSDWESSPPSPIPMPTSRVGAPARSRSIKPHQIKVPKVSKPPKLKVPKTPRPPRPPRPPGAMGTNVHSAVAGISTSNALSLLTPPPLDAKPGSVHAPWLRLTEWEMARLRKRMKKNAIWTPSETMIRRELSDAHRGPENYMKARNKATETGEELLDCDGIANMNTSKQLLPGEIRADSLGTESKLSNKGMKLNQAKKLKKEILAREQAKLAAREAEEAARRLGDLGSSFKSLFTKPHEPPLGSASSSSFTPISEKTSAKPKKRKHEASVPMQDTQLSAQLHSEIVLSPTKTSTKKRKTTQLNTTVTTTTTTIPLAAPAPSPIKISNPVPQPASPTGSRKPTAAAARSRRPSLTLRGPAPISEKDNDSPRPVSRQESRHASAAPAAESMTREQLRRKSTTPAPIPVATAASRRSKRPAPGPVTNSQDGGAAVSVGRRKNAPRKRGTAAAANAAKKAAEGSAKEKEEEGKLEEEAAGEEIDPDEPRYCLCGDVSFGTMIGCENPDVSPIRTSLSCYYTWRVLMSMLQCEKEWFHLDCVGLQEPPGRRVKWYCPDCKTKLGKK